MHAYFLRASASTGHDAWLVSAGNPFDLIEAVCAGLRELGAGIECYRLA